MNKRNQKNVKQPWVLVIIIVFVLAMFAIAAYVTMDLMAKKTANETPKASGITTFQECADAGFAVQMSYPEVCVTSDGASFTNTTE